MYVCVCVGVCVCVIKYMYIKCHEYKAVRILHLDGFNMLLSIHVTTYLSISYVYVWVIFSEG